MSSVTAIVELTEQLLNDLRMHAVLQQDRRAGVAQVMERKARKTARWEARRNAAVTPVPSSGSPNGVVKTSPVSTYATIADGPKRSRAARSIGSSSPFAFSSA
jgi:hypothetical protein